MTPAGPYAEAADTYWRAGWRGILPVPARTKRMRLVGWTGNSGAWPSYADVFDWANNPAPDAGGGNIALRVPHHLLGIDVDDYDGKGGGATLTGLSERWGPLPPTWRSTSRDDGVSGIRFYHVPEGLAWPSNIPTGIEIIRFGHRYAVVWPSIHPEGRTYRWVSPQGVTSTVVPAIDEFPELPDTWIAGLTGGEMAAGTAKAAITLTEAQSWLLAAPGGRQCPRMSRAGIAALRALEGNPSRHDTTMAHQLRLIRYAEEGHHGVLEAITNLHAAFIGAATRPGSGQRSAVEAEAEWRRGLTGAVATIIATPGPARDPDHCCLSDTDLTDLIDPRATNPTTAPVGATTAEDGDGEDQPSSWEPVDLGPYLDGTHVRPAPGLLYRSDGIGLLYPGKVHWMHGESESGKSWCAQIAAVNVITAGGRVLYLDHESDPQEITVRFAALGADPVNILRNLVYVRPDDSSMIPHNRDAVENLLNSVFDLVIVDGVTDALGLDRASTKDTDDVAAWMRRIPRRVAARTGAAVIAIDHVTKDPDTRGRFAIGSQAKMAGIDGAAFIVEPVEPLGEGLLGEIVLRVAKDRPGSLRRHGGTYRKSDRTQEVARIKFDSRTQGNVSFSVNPPLVGLGGQGDAEFGGEVFRPTTLMERISLVLEQHPEGLSSTQVFDRIRGSKPYVMQALDVLVGEGWVERTEASRGSATRYTHRAIKAYRELHDLVEDQGPGDRIFGPTADRDPGPGSKTRGPGRSRLPAAASTGTGSRSGSRSVPVRPAETSGPGGGPVTGTKDQGPGDKTNDQAQDPQQGENHTHTQQLEQDLQTALADGPAPVGTLATRLGADVWDLDMALDRLLAQGLVTKNKKTTGPPTWSLPDSAA